MAEKCNFKCQHKHSWCFGWRDEKISIMLANSLWISVAIESVTTFLKGIQSLPGLPGNKTKAPVYGLPEKCHYNWKC